MLRITEVQDSFVKDLREMEEFFLNEKSQWETEKEIIVKKEEVKTLKRIEEVKIELNVEIDRLTVLVNIYKEKLTRREQENVKHLITIKQYKEWASKYEQLKKDYNLKCNELENFIASTKI